MKKAKYIKGSPSGKKRDLEVIVLHSRCIGASVCVYEAKGSFKLNQARKSLVTDLTKNSDDVLLNAARNCPTQAIFLYRKQKQIWPKPGPDNKKMQPDPQRVFEFS